MASVVPFVVQTIIVSGPLSGGQVSFAEQMHYGLLNLEAYTRDQPAVRTRWRFEIEEWR